MRTTKKIPNLVIAAIFCLVISSCEKPPGPGGRATIKGKLHAKNFDAYAMTVISEYDIAGENVYICYGSDATARNNIKTSYDGSFEFMYLNKGHYKIFAVSRDTSIHIKKSEKTIPVMVEIDINSINQTVDVGEIVINN